MKKNYFLLFAVFLCGLNNINAQIVGGQAFLQGKYLEVGEVAIGAFGTTTTPTTPAVPTVYHPHPGTGATWTPGGALAMVYDFGHDGWSVGTPNFMGDYTWPGTPFEGWELQVGTGRTQAFVTSTFGTPAYATGGGGAGLAGTVTGYTNSGGSVRGMWTGSASAGALQMTQETRVDSLGSSIIVTTIMKNTSAAVVPSVYYVRTCDPDNDETFSSNFATNNTILHQNEDARHMVMVKSLGQTYGANAYLGLATKDCRAKAFIYSGWPLSTATDLATIWTGSFGATYAIGTTLNGDNAIGLLYNIGSIAAGDSAVISYAYIFNGDNGIDSTFPDPQIVINGVPRPIVAPPTANHDSFNVCLYPGMTSLPVSILNATDRDWTWSHWTWSTGLGLATTTGVTNVINVTALPPVYTYTIIGTDSASGMSSCNHKIFYLTILTCNNAVCNSPCAGDSLIFNAPGDSTGATYVWYGPAPSTAVFSTTQRAFIFPATDANNGLYTVIKTVGTIHDTSVTTAIIHHKPIVTAGSNSPLCIGAANTLLLTATADSPGYSYSWTANPSPFTSSVQNPVISGFSASDTGWYQVIAVSAFGCMDTDRTRVILTSVPPAPIVSAHSPYCQFDPFIPFTVSGLSAGGSVLWYTSATGGVGSSTYPVINTAVPGTTYIWFSQIIGSCESLRDTLSVVVNPAPSPIGGTMGLCQYTTTTLNDLSPGGTWTSGTPSIATIDATGLVSGITPGTAVMTYTLPTSCFRTTIVTVYPKPAPPAITPTTYCQFTISGALVATGTNLVWYGTGVTPGYLAAPTPSTSVAGTLNYYVTQTSTFGCLSDSASFPVTIVPEPLAPGVLDTSYCQKTAAPALTATGSNLLWYTSSTGTTPLASAPVPNTDNVGTTTYYVSQTVSHCESHRSPVNVTILYLPVFTIDARLWVCQYDSITMSYDGPGLTNDAYRWELPEGADFANGTNATNKNIVVKFDSALGRHYVYLTASDYNGRCATTDTVDIKVVPAPDASAYINANVCLGDTVTLALNHVSSGAATFGWDVDGSPLLSTTAFNVITHNAGTGGPFLISWDKTGRHIITVSGYTTEGCKAIPTNDTVDVHAIPDARFNLVKVSDRLCVEDSVEFVAVTKNYSNSYAWEPEHFFDNNNAPDIWGRVEQSNSVVKLTVTDPFGCKATYSQQINPDVCCTVWFPNAFTPGATSNNMFRPVFAGFHRFHIFRISNRWGQTIFESTNSNPEWNGTYNEIPQDLGTYFYYIKYDCGGKTLEMKGDVTLVR